MTIKALGYALVMSLVVPSVALSAPTGADIAQTGAAEQTQPQMRAVPSGVEVSNLTDAEVDVQMFSITGSMILQTTVPAGEIVRVELSPGIYIVRADGHAVRLLVR